MDNKIVKCSVQMYTMGTGDCLLLLFKNEADEVKHKMLIDCGVIQISKKDITPYIEKLKDQVNSEIDTLLITHEHQDHVLGFQRAEDIFKNIAVKNLWLAWTEDPNDEYAKKLKEEYSLQKMALAKSYNELKKHTFKDNSKIKDADTNLRMKKFESSLLDFVSINCDIHEKDEDIFGVYKGDLVGFKIIKELYGDLEPECLLPGQIKENIEGLENIRIHVLGPPKNLDLIKKEHGDLGETYEHNNALEEVKGFSNLTHLLSDEMDTPFDVEYIQSRKGATMRRDSYNKKGNEYRKIDFDWLNSTANLALRLKKGINNLSVVLAIEFIESGKIMLFPGDAEYGSWKSWQDIEWNAKDADNEKLTTENILNRTVFYKIAHHMSHNGTAKEVGTDMMIHQDLVAMGTVAYNKIGSSWKKTMPNKELVKDLLNKTKGRLIMMDSAEMYADKEKTIPLATAIKKKQECMSSSELKNFLNKNKVLVKNGNLLDVDDQTIKKKNIIAKEYTVDGK